MHMCLCVRVCVLMVKIALATAFSGIAATVLQGGRTAHTMFKISVIEYNELGIKKKTEIAEILLSTSVIIRDEVVMANRNTIAALDVT